MVERRLPDVVGFLDLSGLQVPRSVDRACRDLRYDGPIFRAPAWSEIYAQDDERIQDWAQAVASDEAVTAAWKHYGYPVIELPLDDVSTRLQFLLGHLHPAA